MALELNAVYWYCVNDYEWQNQAFSKRRVRVSSKSNWRKTSRREKIISNGGSSSNLERTIDRNLPNIHLFDIQSFYPVYILKDPDDLITNKVHAFGFTLSFIRKSLIHQPLSFITLIFELIFVNWTIHQNMTAEEFHLIRKRFMMQ